jgi:uncharacterized membrane protein YjdF
MTQMNLASRIHRLLIGFLMVVLSIELALTLYRGLWMNGFLIVGIILVTLIPFIIGRQYHIHIPSEFQILAVIFIFASLFLGEIYRYYDRFWWWDMALHASSGLLMGILGFLLVYLLNENERAGIDLRPHFVALFAFFFALTVGTLWEIFEFAMDRFVGTNMQKPMLGDPSGLTDTMWDLILDTLGALFISALGWRYSAREESFFVDRWIGKFIARNPRLFRKRLIRDQSNL